MAEYDNTNRGSLWNKKTKDDKKYLGGTVNVNGTEFFISVFKNDNKKSDNSPDYTVSVMEKTGGQEKPAPRASKPAAKAPVKPAQSRRPAHVEDEGDEYEEEQPAPRRAHPALQKVAHRRPAPPLEDIDDGDIPF